MKGTASHLLEFLEGARKRFIIPVYQRNYQKSRGQVHDPSTQSIDFPNN